MIEPTDAEVEALIEANPQGCTLDVIAEAMGVTRQRAMQLVQEATAKVLRALRRRGVKQADDLLPARYYGHKSRDQLFG